ncbi:MAG: adenosylcobalamin-dependent ribonucleoside-diphosphate reductase [Candidatus Melainabacteria bacterium]|nr:adenosylcobalamin-dependent ribonucleoside-diphosphate reductase [Candidatus Melainabacteria bacterium]
MFSANAIKVLEKRYFLKDSKGDLVEDVGALCKRVADHVAGAEQHKISKSDLDALASDFYNIMYNRDFMPNSPTLMNAGKKGGQLSACFVLPVPDSLEGIFDTCKNAALIHKTGGGTGFSFSRLRPANDPVASSTGVASGPVSFMSVYDAATEAIRQGGTRRGANMGMLRVDHPDIELFIACKRQTDRLNNFNISVSVTNAFMKALEDDGEYDLIHPRSGEAVRRVRARYIFDLIVENAHATGEPGLVFIDRINDQDPIRFQLDDNGDVVAGTEDIEATNPCGEQPLGPGDACNLGSINVANFIDRAHQDFNWDGLEKTIQLSVRFLDNVIDSNNYPLPFIAAATLNNRRIGLGIMGWAEALIELGVAYDSEEALKRAESFMQFFQLKAHEASQQLASKRGVFPNWPFSSWHETGEKLRNATVTTIAPTGTISIIAGTSSGIEPLFAISYVRRVLGGTELIEVNPLFEKVAKERGFYSEELMERIAREGTLKNVEGVPDDIKKVFVSSHDIGYSWHVRMQAAFQKYTDNAVSKTINFPVEATFDDIEKAYLLAWELGLKGITVYRDASRQSQVLNIAKTDPLKKLQEASSNSVSPTSALNATAEQPERTKDIATTPSRYPRHDTKLVGCGPSAQAPSQSAFRGTPKQFQSSQCPECGFQSKSMIKYEACLMCVSCGYTKC